MVAEIIQGFYQQEYGEEVLPVMREVGYRVDSEEMLEYSDGSKSFFSFCCCWERTEWTVLFLYFLDLLTDNSCTLTHN